MMFSLLPFSLEYKNEWDTIVKNSKQGNFIHLVDYFTYHKDRFDDCSLIVYKKRKEVAVFPANKIGDEVHSHSGLTYAGLIYGTDLTTVDVLTIFKLIKVHYSEVGFVKLFYKCIPQVFSKYPAQEDLYALFRLSGTLYRRDVSTVISLQDDRPKLNKGKKHSVKKGIKAGLKFKESNDFESFHSLLSEVLEKFDAKPVHTLSEMLMLKTNFQDKIKLYTACLNDDELIAGTITFDFGHIIHTQYMATGDEGRKIGALDFILYNLIENEFKDRQYLSFGCSTENNGRYLNEGLIAQKEHFGGRAVVHDFYQLELAND